VGAEQKQEGETADTAAGGGAMAAMAPILGKQLGFKLQELCNNVGKKIEWRIGRVPEP